MDPIREYWNLPVPSVAALELPWTPVYLPGIEPEPTDYVVTEGLQAAPPRPFVQIIRSKEGHTGVVGVLKPKGTTDPRPMQEIVADSLLTLDLDFRTTEVLWSAGIKTVSQLAKMPKHELRKIRGLTRRARLSEIQIAMDTYRRVPKARWPQ